MFFYKDSEAEKWAHRPLGSKLLCERLGIQYEDYQNGSDDDVNAFLDLLTEIPLQEIIDEAQKMYVVLEVK